MAKQNKHYEWNWPMLGAGVLLFAAAAMLAAGSGWAADEKPAPTTTADPNVPMKELRLMIRSLTKDDLKVEADGWVAVLKEQAGRVDRNKIEAIEEVYMIENGLLQAAGSKLPTVERRSGEDRRKADSQDFFARGGIDRRSGVEARQQSEKE